MMSKFIASAALLTSAFAAPSTLDSRDTTVSTKVASFVQPFPYLPIEPINVLASMDWQGMAYGKTGNVQTAAVVAPNTGGNVAEFSGTNLVTIQQGQPAMRISFQGTQYNTFSLLSFYYGCALVVESVAGVPTGCTITINGFSDDARTKRIASQTFTFTPNKKGSVTLSTNMVKAVPSTQFRGLKRVDFVVSNPLTTAGLIDSVTYGLSK